MIKHLRLLTMSVVVCCSGAMAAQNVNLNIKNTSVKNAIAEIEKNTQYKFFFSPEVVNLQRQVSISTHNGTLQDALRQLIAGQPNLEYTLDDHTVILRTKQPQAPQKGTSHKTNTIDVIGNVVDNSGEPIIGAYVKVKNSKNMTVTNMDGQFTLKKVPTDAEILITFVGCQPLTVKASQITNSKNLVLQNDNKSLDEVVVIGYGKQSRAKVTGAIANIKADKLLGDLSVPSFDQALASKLPGVDIQQTSGAPGSAMNIKIRGNNSINFGGHPLIVVDGLPLSNSAFNENLQGRSSMREFQSTYSINPLSLINPYDIESIDVLKDAASTAIYGSRGSNGVIIITTKKGHEGKPTVGFRASFGFQHLSKKVNVMNAYEYANFAKNSRDAAWKYAGGNPNASLEERGHRSPSYTYPAYLLPYIQGQQGLTDTDWQDEIYRTAPQQNYEVSVGGGNKDFKYYLSGNYNNTQGIIINSGLKRYSFRTNVDGNITKKLHVSVGMNVSRTDNKLVQSEGAWWKEGAVIAALMYHPNLPAYNEDGSVAINTMIDQKRLGQNVAQIQNPIAVALLEKNKLVNMSFIGNGSLEYAILDNLKLKTQLGVESLGMHRTFYRPKSLSYSKEYAPTTNYNYGLDSRASIFNWISETSLTWLYDYKKSSWNVMGDFSAQRQNISYSIIEGKNFPNDNVNTINAAATTSGTSYAEEAAMASFLGRVIYTYDDKYMVTGTIRFDGSSRFAADSKWGCFPSVSAGWNIHKEHFYPHNAFVNNLKIRASYGVTGNAAIPYYGGIAVLAAHNYNFNNTIALGFSPENAPNKNLSWESTGTTNIGVDLSLAKSRYKVSMDWYQSITRDLLLNVTIPATSGLTTALQNIGKIQNQGVEVIVSTAQELSKNWSIDLALTMAANRNKVLALGKGQEQILFSSGLSDPSFILKVGEPIGSFYGYRVQGTFKSQQEFDSTPHLEHANQAVGDFIYADTNNDHKVNEADRVILGNANPKFTWGFNGTLRYKNLDFGFGIEGKHGQKIFNATHRYLAEGWGNALHKYIETDAPYYVWSHGSKNHTRPSSWHVEDGSFVRVRNLSIGYNLPKTKLYNSLRIYFTANNPFIFTKYSGYNPEVSNGGSNAITAGEDFGNYPIAKSYVLGINLTF